MEAIVTYRDNAKDIVEIRVGTHHKSYGGPGDGYCYNHDSFDCELSLEEQEAVNRA